MATIVCHRTSETKDIGAAQYRVYDVVDGQQRLTTLILLQTNNTNEHNFNRFIREGRAPARVRTYPVAHPCRACPHGCMGPS